MSVTTRKEKQEKFNKKNPAPMEQDFSILCFEY